MFKKTVFLISGKLRAGKNQFADYLYQEFKNKFNLKVSYDSFAQPVKDNTKTDFKPIYEYLNVIVNKLKDTIETIEMSTYEYNKLNELLNLIKVEDKNFYEEKTKLTRMLLQIYGTDIFRNKVNNDYWASALLKNLLQKEDDVILITDVRFLNEIDIIKNQNYFNVFTIRVNRPMDRNDMVNEHQSEKALDGYEKWDYVINNDSTLENLNGEAKRIIKTIMNG